MSEQAEACHGVITELMNWQTRSAAEIAPPSGVSEGLQAVPLRTSYVDHASGCLVVGIQQEAVSERRSHERALRETFGDIDLEIRYVTVVLDSGASKADVCRPLRGGTKVGNTTLSLVIKVRNGTKQEMLAILSGHGIGGVGTEVGQPTRLTGNSAAWHITRRLRA